MLQVLHVCQIPYNCAQTYT